MDRQGFTDGSTKLGKPLYTSAEMIEKAGLNWKVRQAPVLFEGNGLTEVEDRIVNFREDTGAGLGIVSPRYQVVQNSTRFAFLDSFVGEQIECFEDARAYRGGAVVFIRARLPGTVTFANNPDDIGVKYVDFYGSHDGSTPCKAVLLAMRLICTNGLVGLKSIGQSRVKHTTNMKLDKLRVDLGFVMHDGKLREELGIMNQSFSILEKLSAKMAEQPFHVEKMPEVLEMVGMIPKEAERSTRAENIIEEVSNLFEIRQKGLNLPGVSGTAWGAYNAITEYVDHWRGDKASKREESAAIGSGFQIKEAALEVLSA